MPTWMWQQPHWPALTWQPQELAAPLRDTGQATRHLADLLEKGLLEKLPGGGRSTRYQVKIDTRG